jgi:integrase
LGQAATNRPPFTAEHTFLTLREGIPYRRRPPRFHDFRHTLACRVLQRWQASRKGAVRRLAIVSRFLGHTQVTDTDWYLSAFPQLMREAVQRLRPTGHENSCVGSVVAALLP